MREGAFDVARSAGGRATGYTLGGVGWYRKHFATPDGLTEGGVATLTFDGAHVHRWPRMLRGLGLGSEPDPEAEPSPHAKQACT